MGLEQTLRRTPNGGSLRCTTLVVVGVGLTNYVYAWNRIA